MSKINNTQLCSIRAITHKGQRSGELIRGITLFYLTGRAELTFKFT